jgi:hypothetical protein
MNTPQEFRVLGLTMPHLTMAYGGFLILWGGLFSIGSESFTSAIPAVMGAPVLLSGILAHFLPKQRKIWMHVAVLFGLLCFLGGFAVLRGLGSEDGMFGNPKAATSQLMLLVTGAAYTASCVRSFIWARKNPPPAA